MRTMCSREIFTKKCRQQQNFDSDPKEAWHYNHVTFTPIAKHFTLYCWLIYMLSLLYVKLTIKVKVGIPESFKVGWYRHKIYLSHPGILRCCWLQYNKHQQKTEPVRTTTKYRVWPSPKKLEFFFNYRDL